MPLYIVMCRMTEGTTGRREGPLRQHGVIQYFETFEAAQAEADCWQARMDADEHCTGDFLYWPVTGVSIAAWDGE